MSNTKQILNNKDLIEMIKEESTDSVYIYHFRKFPNRDLYYNSIGLSQKSEEISLDAFNKIKSYLSGGFTVAVLKTRSSDGKYNAICSLSICSKEDNFNKKVGSNIALKRLHNYCNKNIKEWDYNPDFFFTMGGLSEKRSASETLIEITRYLKNYKYLINRGIVVV